MPYMIRGKVPTRAVGDCPWCEKKQTILHILACYIDGIIGCEYVCAKCLLALDEMTEKNMKGLRGDPIVEIQEDEG